MLIEPEYMIFSPPLAKGGVARLVGIYLIMSLFRAGVVIKFLTYSPAISIRDPENKPNHPGRERRFCTKVIL